MQSVSLSVSSRSSRGSAAAGRLRRAGQVPAVFYGPRREPTAVVLQTKEFMDRVRRIEGTPLIRFESDEPTLGGRVALLKDTQYHPLSGQICHADLYEVDMNEKIQVPVALHFVGKAAGIVHGGILQPIEREVQVECLPNDIPNHIEVDVSHLEIHDSVHVSQLKLPEGVSVVYDDDFTLVTVAAPAAAESAAAAAAAAKS